MNQPPTNQPSGPYQPQPPYQLSNQQFYNDQTQAYPQQPSYPYGQQMPPYPQPAQLPVYPPSRPATLAGPPHPRKKPKQKWLIGCGVAIFVLLACGLCSNIMNAASHQTQTTQSDTIPTATNSGARQTVHMTTYTPTPVATMTRPAPTLTSIPPTPTPQPTPAPTIQPTQPSAQPTQPPAPQPAQPVAQPTQPPAPQPAAKSVNGNPWGYDFNQGNYITDPPADFCSGQYFNCIKNFPNGKGYVVRCNDGMYSRSGGRPGSCSRNGGEAQVLYSH